jgi:putative ABC transport system permease protein
MVWQGDKNGPPPVRGYATPIHALEWRARNASFSDLAVFEPWAANPILQGPDGAMHLRGTYASSNFFDLLGVTAAIGRTFSREDDRNDLIVLSHGLWRSHFGGDPGVIGRTVDLPVGRDRTTGRFTVIGVLPERFRFTYPDETQVWLPRTWSEIERSGPLSLQYQTVARLKPDLSLGQARANLIAVADAMVRDLPDRYDSRTQKTFQAGAAEDTVYLEPIQEYVVGKTRPALILLSVATAFLLLVACANVATLLMARTAQRARELSLRVALGAPPGRVGRQLLTEGIALTAAGGAAGLATSMLLQPILRWTLPASYPRVDEIAVDTPAVLWAGGLVLVTSVITGLAPSWGQMHGDPHMVLKRGGAAVTAGRDSTIWRRALVAAQVTLVVLLMVGGGLLVRTLWNLRQVDLGFDSSEVLTLEMRLFDLRYRNQQTVRLFEDDLLTAVRALPGVESAGIASAIPMRGSDTLMALTTSSGRHRVNRRAVDAAFFKVLRIPLRTGRLFDAMESGDVVVLSESAATLLFPSVDPIGEILEIGGYSSSRARVVGIVADTRYRQVEQPGGPAIYVPRGQSPSSLICLVVRAPGNLAAVVDRVRQVVRTLDPGQPIEGVSTVDAIVSASIADRRFYAVATTAFSLVGLLLAIAGLYGVVSRSVAERVRELGIRIVLGARHGDVMALVLRQGMLPVIVGLAIGGLAAFWTTTLLRRFLFGVDTTDPVTYAAVSVTVVVIAAFACWVPARRASEVDPIEVLRAE